MTVPFGISPSCQLLFLVTTSVCGRRLVLRAGECVRSRCLPPEPSKVSRDYRVRKAVSRTITLLQATPLTGSSRDRHKQKCIPGLAQRCERCTALGFKDCVYEPTEKRAVAKNVEEACKRCRSATPPFTAPTLRTLTSDLPIAQSKEKGGCLFLIERYKCRQIDSDTPVP